MTTIKATTPESEHESAPTPFIGYCPVCDTWTAEYHLHEMQRAES